MNCKHCGKRIVLIPSASERARKYGGKPSDYSKLFKYHAECSLLLRNEAVLKLMRESKRV